MAIVYGLKVNLSVALVAMLNHTELQQIALETQPHSGISFNNNFTTITNLTSSIILSPDDACAGGSEDSTEMEVIYVFYGHFVVANDLKRDGLLHGLCEIIKINKSMRVKLVGIN